MDPGKVLAQLMTFTNTELLDGAGDLDAETPLLELGVLDSLSMVELLGFIDDAFQVKVPEDLVLPEHFADLASIAALVLELHGETASAAESTDELRRLIRLQESYGIASCERKIADDTIHFLSVEGSAPTWLLLPALGNPSSSWAPMMRSIRGEKMAIAPDLAGFGLTTTHTKAPVYRDHLRMMRAFVDTIEGPLVLVANSAGAMIATELARSLPERVRALVVTGFGAIADVPAWWKRLAELACSPGDFLAAAYHRAPKLTPALTRLLADVLARPAYHSFLDDHAIAAMGTCFERITVPTLFVGGEEDRIVPREAVEAAAKQVPGAELQWLARCGHFPPAECPEQLLWFVEDFLARLPQEGSGR